VIVVIYIQSCSAHSERVNAIMETWASIPCGNRMEIHALTGKDLGVPDDYKSLPLKHRAACQRFKDVDFLMKVDTDTYVHPIRLWNSGFWRHDYVGFMRYNEQMPNYALGGPGYWLSKTAIHILAHADWGTEYEGIDDVQVGVTLEKAGIALHHDPRYSPFDPPRPDNYFITGHLSGRQAFQPAMMHQAHKCWL
jgi:hypothetical protein